MCRFINTKNLSFKLVYLTEKPESIIFGLIIFKGKLIELLTTSHNTLNGMLKKKPLFKTNIPKSCNICSHSMSTCLAFQYIIFSPPSSSQMQKNGHASALSVLKVFPR